MAVENKWSSAKLRAKIAGLEEEAAARQDVNNSRQQPEELPEESSLSVVVDKSGNGKMISQQHLSTSPSSDPYRTQVNIGGINYTTSYIPFTPSEEEEEEERRIKGEGKLEEDRKRENAISSPFPKRGELEFYVPHVNDRNYTYDRDSYPGEVVKTPEVPPLAPNYCDLLKDRLQLATSTSIAPMVSSAIICNESEDKNEKEITTAEGREIITKHEEEQQRIIKMKDEIEKLQSRQEPAEKMDVWRRQYNALTTEVESWKQKMSQTLRKANIEEGNFLPPKYEVPLADETPEKLITFPQSWKRAEDDEEDYKARVSALRDFVTLGQLRFAIAQQESIQKSIGVLSALESRLAHDYCECLGLMEYQSGVSQYVEIVFSESQRSDADEETVRKLHLAACIDESRANIEQNPCRKLLPYSEKEKEKHMPTVNRGGIAGGALYGQEILQQCRSAVGALEKSYTYAQNHTQSDMAESLKVWRELQAQGEATRAIVQSVTKSRDERRKRADEHYCRVRDQITQGQLQRLEF